MKLLNVVWGFILVSSVSGCAEPSGPSSNSNPYGPSLSSQATAIPYDGMQKANAMLSPITGQ